MQTDQHANTYISSNYILGLLNAVFCGGYLRVDSVACVVVVVITGDWALVAETVATTAGGIVLEVVTAGRDYVGKKKIASYQHCNFIIVRTFNYFRICFFKKWEPILKLYPR